MCLAPCNLESRFHWSWLLVLILLWPASASAQGLTGLGSSLQQALQQAQSGSLDAALPGEQLALEGAIDPESYTVGPGDVFAISISTALSTQLSLTVTADGLLVVPNVGGFEVAGVSLRAARELVLTGIRRTYRNVSAEVALARPRRFYVHVAGAVSQPGRHVVAPIARVEDALTAAMDNTSPLLVLQQVRQAAPFADGPPFLPALRNIEIRRRDGTTEQVDIWRYYTSGDPQFNPYVQDGDAIHVPAFRDDLASVTIQGEVPNPGTYDHREGDTVLDLLYIANGSRDLSGLGEVRLVRRGAGDVLTLSVAGLVASQGESIAVGPGDHLAIVRRDAYVGVAYVAGYVRYPGSYPIQSGVTSVRDLVELAGGLREDALVRGAYLERRGSARSAIYEPDQLTPYQKPPLQADINPLAITAALEAEVSALSRNSDLSFAGQQFYGRELLQPQRVSADVGAALAGSGAPIPLKDGDRLVIPEDPKAILVVGQVERPGYVPFQSGRTADDYIALAGGRGAASADTYVRKAGTGRIRPKADESLESGDYVFVDRVGVGGSASEQALVLQEEGLALQEETLSIQERSLEIQRRTPYFQIALTAVTTAATIISIILTRPNS